MATPHSHSPKKHKKSGAPEMAAGDAASGLLNKIGSVAGMVGFAPIVADAILPAAGWVVGLVGLKKAQSVLNKPKNILSKQVGPGTLSNALVDSSFTVVSGLEMFGVARSYSEKMNALKEMYSDMTGKKPGNIASDRHVPAAIATARSHLLREHGIRGVLSSLGGLLSVRSLLKGGSGRKTMIAWMVLPMASEGVNLLMGETPVLHVYKGIADAHKRGEPIPPKTYAEFIMAANKDLQIRGDTGKTLASKLADEYAALNAAPAVVLNEIENGRMLQRIKVIMESGEIAPPSHHENPPARHAKAAPGKQEQKVLGPETAKIVGRREASEPSPVLGA